MTERVHVAAAVIVNPAGEILIAKRHDHLHQGGLWEFPGGKLENAEAVEAALARELNEELGITVRAQRPLIRVYHDYPDKQVLLDVWYVNEFEGEAHGKEDQPIAWVRPDDLREYDFPAANQPIIYAAQLPDSYLVTPEPVKEQVFLEKLEQALLRGIQLVQLRAHELDDEQYLALAKQCQQQCHAHNARLLLNRDVAMLEKLDADGIHLTSTRLHTCRHRPVAKHKLFSASCHTLEDIEHAAAVDADFIVVGPVNATTTHPDATPLGWEQFQALTDRANIPVYALGGMHVADRRAAWHHGGQGIAAITGLWQMP